MIIAAHVHRFFVFGVDVARPLHMAPRKKLKAVTKNGVTASTWPAVAETPINSILVDK
jgi:hypothetical protein